MTLDECRLAPAMHEAAQKLLLVFPFVVFTSGRRSLQDQAEVMAQNILKSGERTWIRQTYLHAAELQTAVDAHPEWMDEFSLTEGLHATLVTMGDEAFKVTDHLAGMAVDIKPLERLLVMADLSKVWVETEEGRQIISWIRAFHATKSFLTREGKLRRWHWSVKPPASIEV